MTKEKLSFHDIFYIFLFGCVLGWFIEGVWTLFKKGLLINHSALVIGPFNVVYGVGAVLLSVTLHHLVDKKNVTVFVTSFVTGSILEYVMSFCMEMMFGFTAWTYRKKPFNINGRICLTYSLFWGLLGVFWIRIVYPWLKGKIDRFNKVESMKFLKIFMVFLVFDVMLTVGAINRGKEFEEHIPPKNKMEEIYDKYFGVDYLNNMFNNRWNKK